MNLIRNANLSSLLVAGLLANAVDRGQRSSGYPRVDRPIEKFEEPFDPARQENESRQVWRARLRAHAKHP